MSAVVESEPGRKQFDNKKCQFLGGNKQSRSQQFSLQQKGQTHPELHDQQHNQHLLGNGVFFPSIWPTWNLIKMFAVSSFVNSRKLRCGETEASPGCGRGWSSLWTTHLDYSVFSRELLWRDLTGGKGKNQNNSILESAQHQGKTQPVITQGRPILLFSSPSPEDSQMLDQEGSEKG